MKNKNFIIIILSVFFLNFHLNANEIKFTAKDIETKENGNLIIGKNQAQVILNNNFEINANKFEYYKQKEILEVSGDVLSKDELNKIDIKSDFLTYEKNNELIIFEKNIK